MATASEVIDKVGLVIGIPMHGVVVDGAQSSMNFHTLQNSPISRNNKAGRARGKEQVNLTILTDLAGSQNWWSLDGLVGEDQAAEESGCGISFA